MTIETVDESRRTYLALRECLNLLGTFPRSSSQERVTSQRLELRLLYLLLHLSGGHIPARQLTSVSSRCQQLREALSSNSNRAPIQSLLDPP